MNKMKVVFIEKPGNIQFSTREIPEPKLGEALIKIKYCGICGSDIATYTGNQPFATYPRIPGHEFSGEIVKINGNGNGLLPGMIVTANPYFNCNACYSCRKGKVNCCEHNETMGVQKDGAFAEYITMPIERIINGCGLNAETLALVEPFSIGYHAVKRGQIEDSDKVLVIGAGPIGIMSMIAAKVRGAKVYITDLLDKRLQMALSLGADEIIDLSKENLTERIKALTNGDGVDVCIEAVGYPDTFLNCIEQVAFSGKVVLIGNGKKETTFNHSILLKKELTVFGSRNSLNDFAPIVRLMKNGMLNLNKIITDVYELDHVVEAFEDLKNNDGSKAKVLIKF